MGMFDYVKTPEIHCPKCSSLLQGFQSKDGDCTLSEVDFSTVDNFYTGCKCGSWIEFVRKRPVQVPLEGYNMYVDEELYGEEDE